MSLSGWRVVYKQKFFRLALLACGLLLLAGVLLVWFALFPAVESWRVVPLHYNIHIGVDKVGKWWELFIPSGIGVILTLLNAGYASIIWKREKVIAYAAIVTAVVVDVLILVHLIFLVHLNVTYYA
ncbi:TPA: hypothetical protein DEP96_00560 [Candidatus Uhrbacteria bacterium]|nr:hypothetical protein [Candidatus Uhrbacteria bacterium]